MDKYHFVDQIVSILLMDSTIIFIMMMVTIQIIRVVNVYYGLCSCFIYNIYQLAYYL
jgi:hypothetical protein